MLNHNHRQAPLQTRRGNRLPHIPIGFTRRSFSFHVLKNSELFFEIICKTEIRFVFCINYITEDVLKITEYAWLLQPFKPVYQIFIVHIKKPLECHQSLL